MTWKHNYVSAGAIMFPKNNKETCTKLCLCEEGWRLYDVVDSLYLELELTETREECELIVQNLQDSQSIYLEHYRECLDCTKSKEIDKNI